MSDTDFDWAAARGEKWRANLSGMEAMLSPIDAPLLAALRLDAPFRIADIACGGGGTTIEIARSAPAGSVVHGFDLAPGLIDTARARATQNGLDVTFTVADVATTSPPPYQRLVSRFGVMFFDDPPAAFGNLAKWLTPDGRFAFVVWAKPTDNPITHVVREVVAEIVELPPPVPDTPGPFRYADVDTLLTLLRDATFTDVQATPWRGQLAYGGGLAPSDAATFALSAFSVAEPVAKAPEAAQQRAHRLLTERLSQHVHDGVVRLDAAVHVVTGGV